MAKPDLAWEARGDGIVRLTHGALGCRDLADRLDGRSLCDFHVGDTDIQALAVEGRSLRGRRVTVAGIPEPLLLSGCAVAPRDAARPWLRGTISLADGAPEQVAAAARAMTADIGARRREEQLRRETEIMLLGLRLLLGDLSLHEKLERLAHDLAGAFGGDDVRLVQVRPGGSPRAILPQTLPLGDAPALRRALAAGDSRATVVFAADGDDNAALRRCLAMGQGDIVLVALPVRAERYYLFCRARRALGQDGLGLAERMSLLMQQALVLQDDQNRMVHAAKLSALGQMSTSIAHELRQPLNTISIAAQNIALAVEMEQAGPELLREKTARILSQIERACKVMDRMRRFGRRAGGDQRPVALLGIATGARALMSDAMEKMGIGIEVAVAADIAVIADELEIEQVLVNLIQNGADAIMQKGARTSGAPGCIRLRSQDEPACSGMVRLHVEDDGPGFPPQVLQHALDAFFTTKPEGQGTGLGLSIANAILREHGGSLLIGNGETGARVTLLLRRAPCTKSPRDGDVIASRPALRA